MSKVMSAVLAIVVLAGIAGLGWALYDPVSQFLSGTMKAREEDSLSSAQENMSQQESLPAQAPTDLQQETLRLSKVKGVYLPLSSLQNEEQLQQTLTQLKAQGINTILIDTKNERGQVLYQSSNQTVAEVAAQVAGAVDLSRITALAKENGMAVIARIYAFRDPISSLILKKAAVKYQDTEMLWLDDSKENGGKSWLNPYSEIAQMYIADLSLECIRSGCSAVMLAGVQFPSGYSLELAGYGTQTKTRQQVLSDFVQDMEELLQENGGTLIYASSAQALLGMEASSFDTGGLQYSVKNICPDVRPSSFAGSVRPESLAASSDPAGQPHDTVKAVMTQLKQSGGNKTFLPMLQAYTDPSSALEYTELQVKEQIQALEEVDVTGYILYNEQGNYPLS